MAGKTNVIDVRTWNPGAVRWETLPPDYVAAYLHHQFGLAVPGEQPGENFKEMFDKSSPDGKRFLAEHIGMRNPYGRKTCIKFTPAQQEQVWKHFIENTSVRQMTTDHARYLGQVRYYALVKELPEELAARTLDLLIAPKGSKAAFLHLFYREDGIQMRFDAMCRALDQDPEIALALKNLFVKNMRAALSPNAAIEWLNNYVTKTGLPLEGGVVRENPWEPVWKDILDTVRNTPIRDWHPPAEPEWEP